MELTHTQLKDVIANIDADVYIVRKDYKEVSDILASEGYLATESAVKRAVNDLADNDHYFIKLAKDLQ